MPFRIHVIDVQLIEGKAKATGNDYKMHIVQGILDYEGEQSICEFTLPRDLPVPQKGIYTAELRPVVGRQDKRLYGEILSLTPARQQAAAESKG